ncbi:MAG: undecaprenyl-diphosphate phosphatase [Chloroflexi bacterium]|nr:MAG: undecaprenyl-diphosphate phosphatase [Chloroflexota bacterium]
MDLVQAVVIGVVEGITEFLPISSTFHVIWASRFLGLSESDFVKLFQIVIQSGAVLAVLALYTRTLLTDRGLVTRLVASFIPTAVVGFVLYREIKDVFLTSLWLQVVVFALVGALFIVVERFWAHRQLTRTAGDLSLRDAALVGLAQALAVVPGVSRAGAVILALIGLGVRRDEAARYSFLLALPTIVAAGAYDLYQSRGILASSASAVPLLLAGAIASFIVALVVIRWFIAYLQSHTLAAFGVYRLVVAVILAALLLSGR